MPEFISPKGNPEIWEEKPEGYFTSAEWFEAHKEEMAKAAREARIKEIDAELLQYDLKSIRPLRAIENGTDETDDHERLVGIRRLAEKLREERKELVEKG